MNTEKVGLTVFKDEKDEPKAIIYFNKNRDRIIYTLQKADDDQIIELITTKKNEQNTPK
jgi:hypothetical protein